MSNIRYEVPRRTRSRLLLIASFVGLLTGCQRTDVATWREEVLLHDGRTIQVERVARAHHSGFPHSRRGADIDYELSYAPLDLKWHSKAPGELMSFDIFDGVPHLALYADGRRICGSRAPGSYKAQFFKWDTSQWKEIEQSKFPTDVALKNLYNGYWGYSNKSDAHGLITWYKKSIDDGFNDRKPHTIRSYHELTKRICKGNPARAPN